MKLAISRYYEVIIWGVDKTTPLFRVAAYAFSEDEAKDYALMRFRRSLLETSKQKVERIEVLSEDHTKPEKRQQSLFEDYADVSLNHSMNDVQGAAVNLLITGIQRSHAKLSDAELRWDELMGRGKEALRRRFNGATDYRDENVVASEIGQRMVA